MRNPLDARVEQPFARPVLTAAAAIAAVLVVFAVGAGVWVNERRQDSVERALLAQGYGPAHVEPIPGDECWRAREGFRWRTATKSGWACAGPGDEVTLHEGRFDGSWP
ncbi:hypothetical protein ACFODL_01690 [Phenylobacterium terrae]|uniref:Uncharacterized protein n=1 Tax=Phenylobacterium terrae TaxID=2665495 RepID=A0ABW4MXB7_9CAUL